MGVQREFKHVEFRNFLEKKCLFMGNELLDELKASINRRQQSPDESLCRKCHHLDVKTTQSPIENTRHGEW